MCGVNLRLAVATLHMLMLLVAILNRQLAELSSIARRTLTLVPGTALATICTWQVTNNWKEQKVLKKERIQRNTSI